MDPAQVHHCDARPGGARRLAWLRCLPIVCMLLGLILLSLSSATAQDESPLVRVIQIDGTITPAMAGYVERAIDSAERARASAIILEIDTPGGLSSAMDDIDRAILESEVPVIAWVAPQGARAASAGVFITYAAHIAAMAPGTSIGSASPVSSDGSEMTDTMQSKVTNDAVSTIRNLADLRGRNADWAESAVREAANITADRALQLEVVNLLAPDRETLLADVHGMAVTMHDGSSMTLETDGARIETTGMNPIESLLQLVSDPTIAYLLMSFGALGIFLELGNPGGFIPGIVGVICLVLGLYALGTLPVNWTGGLLIAIAFALFFIDLFVNAFGLLLISGLTCFIIGSYLLIDPSVPGYGHVSRVAIWTSAALILGSAILIGTAVLRVLRKPPASGRASLIDARGVVRTALAPSGMVYLQGELWAATATSGTEIAPGTWVRVTDVKGLRLYVEPSTAPAEREAARQRPRGEGVLPVIGGVEHGTTTYAGTPDAGMSQLTHTGISRDGTITPGDTPRKSP